MAPTGKRDAPLIRLVAILGSGSLIETVSGSVKLGDLSYAGQVAGTWTGGRTRGTDHKDLVTDALPNDIGTSR